MKPLFILQHLTGDGPAHLERWLVQRGLAFRTFNTEAGEAFPDDLSACRGLAILGGEMSANDPLPSLRQAEALFLEAVRDGIPTLGHCLGGQLMARALGAEVGPSPAPEVGWQTLALLDEPQAALWLGPPGANAAHTVFQWHFEAFALPAGARLLARSGACPHQAFSLGPHLAMQWHVELDDEKLQRWSHETSPGYEQACATHPQSVQTGAQMRALATQHLAQQQVLANRIYSHWVAQMRPD